MNLQAGLGISLLLIWSGGAPSALAQIHPDRTLSPESSRLQRRTNRIIIDGGVQRGSVLFHSFEQFSIPDNQSALFANPANIESIVSRITGNTPSNIDGTLGVLGTADLFLLNPNGILFGPNAQLDMAGSFTASTGDRLTIGDVDFSAVAPAPVPLLSLNITPGIQLGPAKSGRIQNQARLTLSPGQTLTLNGGTIDQSGQITIPGGTVNLRGRTLSLTGDINTRDANNQLGELRLSSPNNLKVAATAPLTNQAIVDALQNNAVVIESDRNLSLVGALFSPSPAPLTLISGNDLNVLPNNGDGLVSVSGDITLQSDQNILVENQLFILGNPNAPTLRLQAAGDILIQDTPETTDNLPSNMEVNMLLVDDGLLSIQADNLTVQPNGFLGPLFLASTAIQGIERLGIDITLTGDLLLKESSIITAQATLGKPAGDVNIQTGGSVTLESTSRIASFLFFNPPTALQTGNITVRSRETILLQSGSVISTTTTGTPGDIVLTAPHVVMDGSQQPALIIASTLFPSPNDAGNVTINATESLELMGNQPGVSGTSLIEGVGIDDILAQSTTTTSIQANALGFGASGQILINTKRLNARDGVVIANASGLQANLTGPIGIEGSSTGSASVIINAEDILIQGLAAISNATLGSADGGRLEINSDRIRLENGAGIGVSSILGTGDAGELIIRTDDLEVTGGSVIAANSDRGGGSGLLDIQANTITVDGTTADGQFPSSLLTDVSLDSTGSGGPLNIRTRTLNVLNGGQIRASTQGGEKAGNLNITADTITLSGISSRGIPSTIEAQSTGIGEAGNIQLSANLLAVRDGAAINTRSLRGNGGDIRLDIDEFLLLRRDSQISAEAGLEDSQNVDAISMTDGDGGNITINAGFIVSPTIENSDITANASGGNGGDIKITTNALLLGIAARGQSTSFSDITASSGPGGVDGTITIAGAVEDLGPEPLDLPIGLVEESDRITAGCLLDEDANFIVTGRGGIPANPSEVLNQSLIWQDSRADEAIDLERIDATTHTSKAMTTTELSHAPSNVVEAQGWTIGQQGQIELVAIADRPIIPSATSCHAAVN